MAIDLWCLGQHAADQVLWGWPLGDAGTGVLRVDTVHQEGIPNWHQLDLTLHGGKT